MVIFRGKLLHHQNIYYWALILLAVSLPLSLFCISVAMITLFINWILEGDLKNKMVSIVHRKGLLVFLLFYIFFVIGLLHTINFAYAFHDLKIKLPVFVLPLIIGTSPMLKEDKLRNILLLFVLAVMVASLISTAILFGFYPLEIKDTRNISLFISHIRFSLLVNLAIFILLYYIIEKGRQYSTIQIAGFLAIVFWLGLFLLLLKSATGIIIFFMVSIITAFILIRKIDHLVLRIYLVVLIITIPVLGLSYITHAITRFYTIDKVDFDSLENTTLKGNRYIHYTHLREIENGHYVWLYVCEEELRSAWNLRSLYVYDGKDKKGQAIKHTLIRYLASKNARKDANGLAALTDEDIRSIEEGKTNYIFNNTYSLYPKLYEIIWQVDQYKRGSNPSGHSVTQRLEYMKTGMNIIKDNFWFGVGTGDVRKAFDLQYEKEHSMIQEKYRYRAHNQYMTIFITLGVFGFLVCMFTIFYPVYSERGYKSFLFIVFFLIALLSMINEDTLETHAGVSFFAFFYSLLLFGVNNKASTTK